MCMCQLAVQEILKYHLPHYSSCGIFILYLFRDAESLSGCGCACLSYIHWIESSLMWSGCWPESGRAIDWWCFYYFIRNSLVALLEALFARIFLDLRSRCAVKQVWVIPARALRRGSNSLMWQYLRGSTTHYWIQSIRLYADTLPA